MTPSQSKALTAELVKLQLKEYSNKLKSKTKFV